MTTENSPEASDAPTKIARRAAKLLGHRKVVNLGIGIPTLIADISDGSRTYHLHSENGILDFGPLASENSGNPDAVNAAKQPIRTTPRSSYFSSDQSFGMIRGGHVDVAVVGALEVDVAGTVANWALPGGKILGVGGAMDLLEGAKDVIVTMRHASRTGAPKLVEACSLPITSRRPVTYVVTELATFKLVNGRLCLMDIDPDHTFQEVQRLTGFELTDARQEGGTDE